MKLDSPEDEADYKKMLIKRVLRYLVYTNQGVYLRHLNSKRSDTMFTKDSDDTNNKANDFMTKLLEKALVPMEICAGERDEAKTQCPKKRSDWPSLKEMIDN